MATKFNMTRDINGYNGFGIYPTQDIKGGSLAATVEQHFTVPSTYKNWIAIFSYSAGAPIWVAFNTTAVQPTGTVGTINCALNPAARAVKAGDTISFITDDASSPWVCVELQAILPYTS